MAEALIHRWSDAGGGAQSAAKAGAGAAESPDHLVARLLGARDEHLHLFARNIMGGEAALESAATIVKQMRISIVKLAPSERALHVQRLAGVTPASGATMPTGVVVHGGGALTYSGDGLSAVGNGLPLHFEAVATSKPTSERLLAKLNLRELTRVERFVSCARAQIRNLERNFGLLSVTTSGSRGVGDDLRAQSSSTSTSAQSPAAAAPSSSESSAAPAALSSASSAASSAPSAPQSPVQSDGAAAAAVSSDAAATSPPSSAQPSAAAAPSVGTTSAASASTQHASVTASAPTGGAAAAAASSGSAAATSSSPPPPVAPALASQPASARKPETASSTAAAASSAELPANGSGVGKKCFNCGGRGHKSRKCQSVTGLSANFQGCYHCRQHGHLQANCPNNESSSAAASSSSGGVAAGKCTKCGNSARAGLTTCRLCASTGRPVGLSSVDSKTTQNGHWAATAAATQSFSSFSSVAARGAPAPAFGWSQVVRGRGRQAAALREQAEWQQQQQQQQEASRAQSILLAEVETLEPHRRNIAKRALSFGVSVEHVRAALHDHTLCMLGDTCNGPEDGCFRRRHSLLPVNIVAPGSHAANSSVSGSAASTSSAAAVDKDASGGYNGNARDAGGRGGRGGSGRGGASGTGRPGRAAGHGGERNGGAQSGGVASSSSSSAASSTATAAPAAVAPAAAAPGLERRMGDMESSLTSFMADLRAEMLAAISQAIAVATATTAAAAAAASVAQQPAAGSQ